MALPTKATWNTLKSNAGIAKAPWYKPADAAVGPALSSLESAKAKWKAKPEYDSAAGYVIALGKLHAAFDKFLDKKDLTAAGPLGKQVAGWMDEVAAKHAKIQGKLPALKAAKADAMAKMLEEAF